MVIYVIANFFYLQHGPSPIKPFSDQIQSVHLLEELALHSPLSDAAFVKLFGTDL